MMWIVEYLDEAIDDLNSMDKGIRAQIVKGINKVLQNPKPQYLGGYGKALGNVSNRNLTGFYKIKFRDSGIRVIYKLYEDKGVMTIIVVGIRSDSEVYDIALKRKTKFNL